jgi:alpha-tubulin suppressor-like RCC1 family protein
VAAVAAGFFHSYALLDDGTLRFFGGNFNGQSGDGTNVSRTGVLPIPGLSDVRAVAAGDRHGLALLGNGSVVAWGSNEEGRLASGR